MPRHAWIKLPRLYLATRLASDARVTAPEQTRHYLSNVLRRGLNDQALLFNGHDGEWLATIMQIGKNHVELKCIAQTRQQEPDAGLTLMFAPLKRDHLDAMIQKACEIGVGDFMPVITRHSAVPTLNSDRLQLIAREAAEQSERLTLPRFHALRKLPEALASATQSRPVIACIETGQSQPVMQAMQAMPRQAITILVGPEGGFSDAEIAQLQSQSHVTCVSLGPRILRADTAAIAALSCWQAARGDWCA